MLTPNLAWPELFGFSPREKLICSLILKRAPNFVRRETLRELFMGVDMESNSINVYLCRIRKSLRRHGIELITSRGEGVYLTKADAAYLQRLIDAAAE